MKPIQKRIPCFLILSLFASCSTSNDLVFESMELEVNASPSMSSAVGDLDNDGDLDVLVVRKNASASIFINDGEGVFTVSDQEFPRHHLTDGGIADLNLDGYPDLILVQYDGPNLLLLNDGSGRFPQITQDFGWTHGR